MTTRRFTISNIILYVLICGIIFFIQHIVAIDLDDPFRYLNVSEYILIFFILSLVGAWYFIYEYKQRKLKLNFPLAILLFGFFIVFAVVTFMYPEDSIAELPTFIEVPSVISIHVSLENRFLFVLINFFALLFIYIFLAVIPLKVHSTRHLNFVFYLMIILAIVAFVYSLFVELDAYLTFFDAKDAFEHKSCESFTNNSNSYAMILLFGFLASLFLHHTTNKFWWYIFAFFFFFATFPTFCRTNLAICTFVLVGYLIVRMIVTYKKHPYINSVLLFFSLFFVGVIAVSYYFFVVNGSVYNAKLMNIISHFIAYFYWRGGESRSIFIQRVAYLLNQGYWVTGVGFGLFSFISLQYNQTLGEEIAHTDSTHNGYFYMLGSGGWLLTGLLVIALLYLLWMMIRIYRRHKTLVFLTIFILIGFAFHMLTEATVPLIPSTAIGDCLAMTIFAFVPVYATYYHECHTNINKEIVREASELSKENIKFKAPFGVGQTISIFGVLSFGITASLLAFYEFDLLWIIIASSTLLISIVIPLLIELLIQKKKFNIANYSKAVLIPYSILAVIYGGLAIGLHFVPGITYLYSISIIVGFPFIYLGVFCVIPYYNRRTGVLTPTIDFVTLIIEKRFAKKLRISDKSDRPTLYEKATRFITPKPFRNEE